MLLDLLILGIGAACRGVKNANNRAAGMAELKRLDSLPVWDRVAQQCCKTVTINGKTHDFLTPYEITLNKLWWDSNLELEEFLVKRYIEYNNHFVNDSVRMIDKNGIAHIYGGYDVLCLYNNWKSSGKLKNK